MIELLNLSRQPYVSVDPIHVTFGSGLLVLQLSAMSSIEKRLKDLEENQTHLENRLREIEIKNAHFDDVVFRVHARSLVEKQAKIDRLELLIWQTDRNRIEAIEEEQKKFAELDIIVGRGRGAN